MADRVSVSITIGGKLPADRLPELYKLADFYGLSTEWGGEPLESVTSGEPLRLHAHEVQNGNIEDIEDFCCTNDLPFRTWSGGSPGSFSPEVRVWPGHGPRAIFSADDNESVVLTLQEYNALGDLAAIGEHFRLGGFKPPALSIVPGKPESLI